MIFAILRRDIVKTYDTFCQGGKFLETYAIVKSYEEEEMHTVDTYVHY